MNCLLIDDEPNALAILTEYIEQYQGLHIIKAYTQPVLALKEIHDLPALDIVFMDVDMPLMSGLELAQAIRHKATALIFTTSHSKYAIDAYELQAEAYLLKPFSFSKFARTLSNVLSKISFEEEEKDEKHVHTAAEDFIFIRSVGEHGRTRKLMLADIILFENQGNYLKVYTEQRPKNPFICYLSMKDLMIMLEKLKADYFVRIHRGFVISTHFIDYIDGNRIYMKNGLMVTAGGSYRVVFQSFITDKIVATRRRR